MHNVVLCMLSLYDVARHLHIKLKSFSNIAQPLHDEALRGCSSLYIIAKKSMIMSKTFLVYVSILSIVFFGGGITSIMLGIVPLMEIN